MAAKRPIFRKPKHREAMLGRVRHREVMRGPEGPVRSMARPRSGLFAPRSGALSREAAQLCPTDSRGRVAACLLRSRLTSASAPDKKYARYLLLLLLYDDYYYSKVKTTMTTTTTRSTGVEDKNNAHKSKRNQENAFNLHVCMKE